LNHHNSSKKQQVFFTLWHRRLQAHRARHLKAAAHYDCAAERHFFARLIVARSRTAHLQNLLHSWPKQLSLILFKLCLRRWSRRLQLNRLLFLDAKRLRMKSCFRRFSAASLKMSSLRSEKLQQVSRKYDRGVLRARLQQWRMTTGLIARLKHYRRSKLAHFWTLWRKRLESVKKNSILSRNCARRRIFRLILGKFRSKRELWAAAQNETRKKLRSGSLFMALRRFRNICQRRQDHYRDAVDFHSRQMKRTVIQIWRFKRIQEHQMQSMVHQVLHWRKKLVCFRVWKAHLNEYRTGYQQAVTACRFLRLRRCMHGWRRVLYCRYTLDRFQSGILKSRRESVFHKWKLLGKKRRGLRLLVFGQAAQRASFVNSFRKNYEPTKLMDFYRHSNKRRQCRTLNKLLILQNKYKFFKKWQRLVGHERRQEVRADRRCMHWAFNRWRERLRFGSQEHQGKSTQLRLMLLRWRRRTQSKRALLLAGQRRKKKAWSTWNHHHRRVHLLRELRHQLELRRTSQYFNRWLEHSRLQTTLNNRLQTFVQFFRAKKTSVTVNLDRKKEYFILWRQKFQRSGKNLPHSSAKKYNEKMVSAVDKSKWKHEARTFNRKRCLNLGWQKWRRSYSDALFEQERRMVSQDAAR